MAIHVTLINTNIARSMKLFEFQDFQQKKKTQKQHEVMLEGVHDAVTTMIF